MAKTRMTTRLGGVLMGVVGLAALGFGCRPKPQATGGAPRVVANMNRGVGFMGQYRYEEAVQAFEAVLREAPDLADAQVNLAIALFNRNRKEDLAAAGQHLEAVLQKEPANLRARYFQAIVFQHVGKAEQAIPCLETVLKARSDDGAAWYLLGLCKQRVGQPAENEFLKAVQLRPYLYSAYYQLYQIAMRAGQESQARQYLDRFKALRESTLGESLEFPQYNQMGDLALAQALPATRLPPVAKSQFHFGAPNRRFSLPAPAWPSGLTDGMLQGGLAAGDLNGDGLSDLVFQPATPGSLILLRQGNGGSFADATAGSGLEGLSNAVACAIGDFDNDGRPDLCVTLTDGIRLFRSAEDRFVEVKLPSGSQPATGPCRSALFLDADHDGDLDVFVCGQAANQLWNNNGDGSWTNIATQAGVACPQGQSTQVLPGDLDGDRDMDLVILRENGPARVFRNELLGRYRQQETPGSDIRGDTGAALQDLDGDGALDIVALGGNPRRLQLWAGDGHGGFRASEALAGVSRTLESWDPLSGFRVSDLDLDGDLDLVVFGKAEAHVLLNDGQGRFVAQPQARPTSAGSVLAAFEVFDVTADLVPDLVAVETGQLLCLCTYAGNLVPPSTALALLPSGVRSRDGRTRSPADGCGVRVTVRAGLREQQLLFSGQSGGLSQSWLPLVSGLGGAAQADFVRLAWPDGVAQIETGLHAGRTHKVAELQRKISSCPVLFAWDGNRFGFVTDFAGVGGLGYFSAPGVAAPPQALEHVKIEPGQLRPRAGVYELRVTEPMEEAAYLDRLELLAVDHPATAAVFPDECLALRGPPPTHELLVVEHPIFPVKALDASGRDCTDNLVHADRLYAYQPTLDRRYIGFCQPHTLALDFANRLTALDADGPLFLFINGFIEYPYSQTVYAASQAHVAWEPIRLEARGADGSWRTIVPDAGVPGGLGRMMTVNLSGRLPAGTRGLRLTTNLEVYYDQVFVARTAGTGAVKVQRVPLRGAELRYLGFVREVSPDGRRPLIYDYAQPEATAPFHVLQGAYTRYGPVEALLAQLDDQYVLMGPGDEIALQFDAARVAPPPPGQVRSFILVSYAYCKDMDLYTATPQTLEPLPFRAMSQYPYPPSEHYPDTGAHRHYRATYNTRLVGRDARASL
jgi:Tfp pilus assembly protein PilF